MTSTLASTAKPSLRVATVVSTRTVPSANLASMTPCPGSLPVPYWNEKAFRSRAASISSTGSGGSTT